ncbi:SH3 domain-containing protein [Rhodobacterales bacterium HKCCE3408]|nr:SH3 domain-containing protein [Rhodobacterales bacterium HKCCE3408]
MLRYVVILCVALYVFYVVAPTGPGLGPTGGTEVPHRAAGDAPPEEIVLETGETWTVDRVIRPGDPAPDPTRPVAAGFEPAPTDPGAVQPVARPEETQPAPETAAIETPEPVDTAEPPPSVAAGRLYVTGDRVNLRAGPSTAFEVVTALDLGTPVDVLGAAEDNWFEIEDVLSGARGFMSGDFLSPEAP